MNPVQKIGEKPDLVHLVHGIRLVVVLAGEDVFPVGHVLQINENLVERLALAAVEFEAHPPCLLCSY
jgi:hypothetical protein